MMNVAGIPTDEVVIFGWPWHGQVRSATNPSQGEVVLPNGATREHPVPERPWNTYRVRVPGTPMVTRTPEQLAADAAAGRSWWSQAILCGSSFQLYGRDLGGWVYSAPDGSRWIIDLAGGAARRLGEIGGPAMLRTLTVTWPSDNGQVTPSLDDGSGEPPVFQWPAPLDITPDGRQAILMLYTNDTAYAPGERPMPVGFLRVEVTGGVGTPFAAEVTVLHDRAETLGVGTYESDLVPGYNDVGQLVSAEGTESRGFTGRIWAAWFGQDGTPIACTLDRTATSEQHVANNAGTKSARLLWVLRVAGIEAARVDLQSTTAGGEPADVTTTGTLNGEAIYSHTTPGVVDPYPPQGPLSVRERLMPRDTIGGVLAGDLSDVMVLGNNLVALYVRLLETGSAQPEHRVIGAACPTTPQGLVVMNETHLATVVTTPERNRLYGPRPYSAWNPVTHVAAPLAATPVGWI